MCIIWKQTTEPKMRANDFYAITRGHPRHAFGPSADIPCCTRRAVANCCLVYFSRDIHVYVRPRFVYQSFIDQVLPVVLHLNKNDFLTKYLTENTENSISEPLKP